MVGETIKIPYAKIEGMRMAVQKLFRFTLPMEAAYWVRRNVESVAKASLPLDDERQAIILKYGEKNSVYLQRMIDALPPLRNDAEEKMFQEYTDQLEEIKATGMEDYHLDPENMEFRKEYDDLMKKEVEAVVNKIELKHFASVKLTVTEVGVLDFMICEDKALASQQPLILPPNMKH